MQAQLQALDTDCAATMAAPDGGMWMICEATYPPSSRGKRVDVYVPPELITSLLIDTRDRAKALRQAPEGHR